KFAIYYIILMTNLSNMKKIFMLIFNDFLLSIFRIIKILVSSIKPIIISNLLLPAEAQTQPKKIVTASSLR
ncbi:MAG: hypothetical protein ACRCU2_05150, partial [Planktothrix sp.]